MSLPSRSKVFAVISLFIAVVLISINVVSCVGESRLFSKDKARAMHQDDALQICVSEQHAIQTTMSDPNQFNN